MIQINVQAAAENTIYVGFSLFLYNFFFLIFEHFLWVCLFFMVFGSFFQLINSHIKAQNLMWAEELKDDRREMDVLCLAKESLKQKSVLAKKHDIIF